MPAKFEITLLLNTPRIVINVRFCIPFKEFLILNLGVIYKCVEYLEGCSSIIFYDFFYLGTNNKMFLVRDQSTGNRKNLSDVNEVIDCLQITDNFQELR